jgi:hypothetical protein
VSRGGGCLAATMAIGIVGHQSRISAPSKQQGRKQHQQNQKQGQDGKDLILRRRVLPSQRQGPWCAKPVGLSVMGKFCRGRTYKHQDPCVAADLAALARRGPFRRGSCGQTSRGEGSRTAQTYWRGRGRGAAHGEATTRRRASQHDTAAEMHQKPRGYAALLPPSQTCGRLE